MTILYNKDGYTVKRHEYGYPVGVEYRISNGLYEFCYGSVCPPLNTDLLKAEMKDYLNMRLDNILADVEESRETHYMID